MMHSPIQPVVPSPKYKDNVVPIGQCMPMTVEPSVEPPARADVFINDIVSVTLD